MATNQFSRHNKTNLSNNSSSPTAVFTMTAGAGGAAKASIIIGALICNKTATAATVSIKNNTAISGEADIFLVKDLKVPAASSIEIGMGKYVMKHDGTNGDVIEAYASAASTFDISLSVLEDVN